MGNSQEGYLKAKFVVTIEELEVSITNINEIING